MLETLRVIPADSRHRNFIIGTWLKSYAPNARRQGIITFYDAHEPRIAETRWQDCLVLTDDDGYTIHGWVCGVRGKLWHVYVVPELRRIRVATRLIELACGKLEEYARPWPYAAHARVNPYLLHEGYPYEQRDEVRDKGSSRGEGDSKDEDHVRQTV